MCESTAFLINNGNEEKIMENVIYIEPKNEGIFLEDILGRQITVPGKIASIKLLDHKLFIEQ